MFSIKTFLIFVTIIFFSAKYAHSEDAPLAEGSGTAKMLVHDIFSGTIRTLRDEKSEKDISDEERFNKLIKFKLELLKKQIREDPKGFFLCLLDKSGETRKNTAEIQVLLEKKYLFELKRKNFLKAALLRQARIWIETIQNIIESEKSKPLDNETAKRIERLQLLFNLVESYIVKFNTIG